MFTTRAFVPAFTLALAGALFATQAHAQKSSGGPNNTIDQTRALNGGIDTNDTAGFPVTLTTPGRYVLTGNLEVPAGMTGIVVSGPNITVDLNGYTIRSTQICTAGVYSQTNCAVSASIAGIDLPAIATGAVVENGRVQGFGGCIKGNAPNMRVQDISAHHCTLGIYIGTGGLAERVQVSTSHIGIFAWESAVHRATVTKASYAIRTVGSLIHGALVNGSYMGIEGVNQPSGVRESMMEQVVTPMIGALVKSMGNNLCNGAAC